MSTKKVVHINSVLNEAVSFLSDNIDNIADIIVLVETTDGYIRFINTTDDADFLYLAHRKVREELEHRSNFLYEDDEDFASEAE